MYSYLELENKSFEDFYLKFCGMQECKPNYSYGPAVRPNYLLHYCLSGQGEYHVNNQVYQIKAGDAFLIMPNVVTYYQADQHEPCFPQVVRLNAKQNIHIGQALGAVVTGFFPRDRKSVV